MVSAFTTVFQVFWALLKIPLFILAVMLALFGLLCAVQYLYLYRVKGYRVKSGLHLKAEKQSFFRRLFIEAPRRIILDYFERDPEYFRYDGLHVFCGEQGSGKTIALVEMMMRIQQEYPRAQCITNLGYSFENMALRDWRQLLTYNNGQKGVIVGIDELQNWFSSGKNTLPPQMLEVVTQNRKNRRIILATSQVFTRMAKGIREQVTLVYQPITFAGAVTWVRIKKPVLDYEGNVTELKSRGSYFFVHTPQLRESYDTYKVIHSLAEDGFKDQPPVTVTTSTTVVNHIPKR